MAGNVDGPVIGIDLGTTYTCVGVWHHERVEIIVNDQGNRTTPSCVAFTDTDRLVGDAAKNQCHANPTNTIFGVKRLIGRRYHDGCLQNDIALFPFKVVAGFCGKPKIAIRLGNEEKQFFAEEISSMILAYMRVVAEAYLTTAVRKAVITVPAYFSDSQRRATKDAGRIAGLNVLRIIPEPTAAAIAYGLDEAAEGNRKNILIFDLGGGTFDVSILILEGTSLKVKAVGGDTHLGGEDFDNTLLHYLAGEFQRKHKKNMRNNPRALRRLRTACERAKRVLSSAIETFVDVECLHKGIDFQCRVTRAKFEELNMGFFKKCMDTVAQCLSDAKMQKGDIDEVVLVGGSTRIPKVQQLLQELFDGKQLCKSINPDEAVAYGAAVQAAQLAGEGNKKVQDLVVVDVTPLSLGIKITGSVMSAVVPRNTPLPVRKQRNYSTVYDNQRSCEIAVYEGERSLTEDNNLLGWFVLAGLPPAPAGDTNILVSFDLDIDGILSVWAENKWSGAKNGITITNEEERLTEEEIQKKVEEAEMYRLEDERRKEKAIARSNLEAFLYNARCRIQDAEVTAKITREVKQSMNQELKRARDWYDENHDAEAHEFENRRKRLEKIIEGYLNFSKLVSSLNLE